METYLDVKPPINKIDNDYEELDINKKTRHYEELVMHAGPKPPAYDAVTVKKSTSPNRKLLAYAAIIAISVAVICGAVTGAIFFKLNGPKGYTTQPTKSSPTPTTSTTALPSGWTEWSPWGECDVTCGPGRRHRTRTCTVESCPGADKQSQLCEDMACPIIVLPQWGHWGGWSDCTKTCGTGQEQRTRVCKTTDATVSEDCSGSAMQNRDCATWSCPDCSEPCDVGSRTSDCFRCECSQNTLSGKVLSKDGARVENVSIADANSPYDIMGVSNIEGSFVLPGVCLGQELVFTKVNYRAVNLVVSSVDTSVTIRISPIENLMVSHQPENKNRLVNESVTICCEASGNPAPDYYEWMKDGRQIFVEYTTERSFLKLDLLVKDNSGRYQCRANNDFSSVFSDEVILTVHDEPDDFCGQEPQEDILQLPEGCLTEGGAKVYNAVKCSNKKCRESGRNETSSCKDDEIFCCGPVDYAKVNINCGGQQQFIIATTRCGCSYCQPESVQIFGSVHALDDNSPVYLGQVLVSDSDVATVNANGAFSFRSSGDTSSLAITVRDRLGALVETTKVVHINPEVEQVVYVNMFLKRKAPSVTLNTTKENILKLGENDTTEMFADIVLPPNSFVTEDGSTYSGTVEASVNVVDPRNIDDVLNAPSEFTFVDDSGNDVSLQSAGMFELEFTTPGGAPLAVDGAIEIAVDSKIAGTATDDDGNPMVKLWTLDVRTGKWVKLSDMRSENGEIFRRRRKRQTSYYNTPFYVANITATISKQWYNFDIPINQYCFSKVRLYENDLFLDEDEIHNALALALVVDDNKVAQYSQQRARSDISGNGYCVAHLCDPSDRTDNQMPKGYIIIEHEGERGIPIQMSNRQQHGIRNTDLIDALSYENKHDSVHLQFSYNLQSNVQSSPAVSGPFYRSDGYYRDTSVATAHSSSSCSSALAEANHFRFFKELYKYNCTTYEYTSVEQVVYNPFPNSFNYYVWNTQPLLVLKHSVCFVKVVTSGTHGIQVYAYSEVGNVTNGSVKPGQWYGYRAECTADVPAVCLEVKPPGIITDGNVNQRWQDATRVRVNVTLNQRSRCLGYETSATLHNKYGEVNSPSNRAGGSSVSFQLRQPYDTLAQFKDIDGIYCHVDTDLATAKKRALNGCRGGISPSNEITDNYPPLIMNANNYAVKFFCNNDYP